MLRFGVDHDNGTCANAAFLQLIDELATLEQIDNSEAEYRLKYIVANE